MKTIIAILIALTLVGCDNSDTKYVEIPKDVIVYEVISPVDENETEFNAPIIIDEPTNITITDGYVLIECNGDCGDIFIGELITEDDNETIDSNITE